MNRSLKPLTLLALPLAFATLAPSAMAETTTDPVGVVKHTLKAGKYNLVGLTLHNAPTVVSKFSGVSGTTLTDSTIDFDTALTANKTYVLEVTSGTLAGTIQEITTWSTNTITTTANLDTDGLAVNDTYTLREAATLQQIFGTNNEAGLQEGTAPNADLVWVPNGSGDFDKYYYHPGSSRPAVTEGWKLLSDGSDATDIPLVYTDALVIESRKATDLDFYVSGSVITDPISLSITSDYTFVSSVFPVGSTLANSGLSDSMQHGTAPSADLLWIPNADATDYDKYYYHPGSSRPAVTAGWKLIGADPATDQASTTLKNGMIIEKRAASPYNAKITPPAGY